MFENWTPKAKDLKKQIDDLMVDPFGNDYLIKPLQEELGKELKSADNIRENVGPVQKAKVDTRANYTQVKAQTDAINYGVNHYGGASSLSAPMKQSAVNFFAAEKDRLNSGEASRSFGKEESDKENEALLKDEKAREDQYNRYHNLQTLLEMEPAQSIETVIRRMSGIEVKKLSHQIYNNLLNQPKATPEMWAFYEKIVDIAEHNANTEGIKIPGFGDWLWHNMNAGAAYYNRGWLSAGKLIFDGLGLENSTPSKWIDARLEGGKNAINNSDIVNQIVTGEEEGDANAVRIITAGLPSAALAYLTAGSSAELQSSATLAAAANTVKNAGPSVAKTAVKVVNDLAKNPNFWLSATTTAGNSYADAKEAGASTESATLSALLNGVSGGLIEMSGGLQAPIGKGNAFSDWMKILMQEGGENIIQGVTDRYYDKAIYDFDAPWASFEDPNAVFNPNVSLAEGTAGAVAGLVYGLPKAVIDHMNSPKTVFPVVEADLTATDGSQLFVNTLENFKNQIGTLLRENNPLNKPKIELLMKEALAYKNKLLKNGQTIPAWVDIPRIEFSEGKPYNSTKERWDTSTLLYKPTSGIVLESSPNRVTTILGRYNLDMKFIIQELNVSKSINFKEQKSEFNDLNTPDELYSSPNQFWKQYNKIFIDEAIARGDEIIMATPITYDNLYLPGTIEMTGYGREYYYLLEKGYVYENGRMIRKKKGNRK